MEDKPLIITLELDAASTAFFNEQRQRYFPAERNFLAAHLTLFHHLPPDQPFVTEALSDWALRQTPFSLAVAGVVFMGKGVAYKIDSPLLIKEHKALQNAFQPWLTPQDRQGLWPHITVQNKVAPTIAKALHEELAASFTRTSATATGLTVWKYLGGPWLYLKSFPFRATV